MLRPFINEVERACQGSLEALGFMKKGALFVLDVNEDIVGSVGLNRAVYRSERLVQVNPVVAVADVPIETRLEELRHQRPVGRYKTHATISRPVGYLMPQRRFRKWKFYEDSDVAGLAADLASAIERYGFPFFHEHLTLRDVYASLVQRRYRGIEQHHAYRLPVAATMLGMPREARKHIEDYLQKLDDRHDGAAEDFRKFAEHVLELVDGG